MKNVIKMFILEKCSYRKKCYDSKLFIPENVFTWKMSKKKFVKHNKNVLVWNLLTKETCSLIKNVLNFFE
jgi:hypothetical protein